MSKGWRKINLLRFDFAVAAFSLLVSFFLFAGSASAQNFKVAQTYAADVAPSAVGVGDFNNDHNLDLAIANQTSNDISVLLGNGDGTFQQTVQYPSGGTGPVSVAVADFDGDGNLDIAIANNTSGNVSVFFGNGDGTFQPAVNFAVGNGPSSIAAGDVNGDTMPDLVVANSQDNTVSVLINAGNRTFSSAATYSVDANPASLILADLNGDTFPDIAVANQGTNDVSVLLNQGNGIFATATNYCVAIVPVGSTCAATAPIQPVSIAVGDLNNDGYPDLAIASLGSTVTVLLNNGGATFLEQNPLSTGVSPHSIVVKDFNGDGNQDVAIADSGADSFRILPGNGDGTFGAPLEFVSGTQPVFVASADFNNDGKFDLAIINSGDQDVAIALGNGDGTFQAAPEYAVGLQPNSIVSGDFNADGILDLLIDNGGNSGSAFTASLLLSSGNATFQPAVSVPINNEGPAFMAVGDFNKDQNLDFVTPNPSTSTVTVVLGNGAGGFGAGSDYATDSGPVSVAVADFSGDGFPDIATANQSGNDVSVLINNQTGGFAGHVDYPVGAAPVSIAAADLNGDRFPDIVVGNSGDQTLSVLLNNGDGTFAAALPYSVGNAPQSVAIADLNGDGAPDLVTVNSADDTVSVLLGNGTGTFAPAATYPIPTSSGAQFVAVADVTGDGIPDIIVADTKKNLLSVLPGNGDGTFGSAINYSTGLSPVSIAVGDFNGDMQLDLATANSGSNNVTLLLSKGATPKAATSTALTSSINPSAFGQSVALTAAITSLTGTPTGTVSFLDGGTQLGTSTVSGGVATLVTSSLAANSHSITAVYSGDSNFAASASPALIQTVNPSAATIGLGSSPNASVYLQAVTFTATIAAASGVQGTDTVTFQDGSTPLGIANVVGNTATLTLNTLSVGTHSITAVYSGNGNLAASSSSPVAQIVNKAAVNSTVASSANPSSEGQPVTFTVTVSPQYPGNTPTGTITLKKNGVTLGTFPLNSGVGSDAISTLTLGSYSITALYNGDSNFTSGTSPTLIQTVDKIATATSLTSSANPSYIGQALSITATVSASSGIVPDGESVSFSSGATSLGTASLSGGTATLTLSSLAKGLYDIKATYAGDGTFSNSISPIVAETISAFSTTTTLASSANPTGFGQSVAFSVAVTSTSENVPTGMLTFKNAGATLGTQTLNNGAATLTNSTLSVGTHTITAVYGGDANNAPSTSAAISQVVTKAPYPQVTPSTTQISFTNGTPLFPGQSSTVPVTFTITSGTITSKQKTPSAKPLPGGDDYTSETDDITQDTGCVGTWQTGESCTINYTFTSDNDDQGCNPANTITVAGNKVQVPSYGCIGTVQFNVPNNPNPIVITYTAMVTNASPAIAMSPITLDFPNTTIGESSQMGATISNGGNVPLNITSIAVTLDPTAFSQTNNCPASLAPQQSCYINVIFAPVKAGSLTGTISVSDNDTNVSAPKTIHLKGIGVS
jgi:Bacterial Ig-like domain (group 3)/FG-GAP-like repeat/Abnormal spindle-like microcephaly-assoc'd, ASPM-SPD-2-Hydin/FG-GAP repeat